MKCPVCPAADIPIEAQCCSNCGADLTPVLRINQLAAAEFNKALEFAGDGNTDLALCHAQGAVAMDENLMPARKLLGKLLWRKRRFEDAIRQWTQAAMLGPEDHEVQGLLITASASLKVRVAKRVCLGVAGVVLLYACMWFAWHLAGIGANDESRPSAVAIPATFPLTVAPAPSASELSPLLPEAPPNNPDAERLSQAFDSYRTSHSRTDTNFQVLTDSLDTVRRELASIQDTLAAERQQRGQVVAQCAILQQQMDTRRKELDSAQDALAVERQRRERAVAQFTVLQQQMDKQRKWRRESLLPILASLRPPNADKLAAEIRTLRAESIRLEAAEKRYQARDLFLIDAIAASGAHDKLVRVKGELKLREAEYQKRMVPWEKATARLRAETRGTDSK
jgi:hypothetical protein